MVTHPTSIENPTLLEYVELAWRRRMTILYTALGVSVVFFGVSFLIPPSFRAITTVIPATSSNRISGLGVLGASLEDLGLGTRTQTFDPSMYSDILESRRLLEQVLNMPFSRGAKGQAIPLIDLIQTNGQGEKRIELAVRRLRKHVTAGVDRRTGILTIGVRMGRPELAAGVANALASLLQDFIVHSMARQASENRHFIEGRLNEIQTSLGRAEQELQGFRERNLRIGNSPRLRLEEERLVRIVRELEEIFVTVKRQEELAKIEEHRDVPVLCILDAAHVSTFRVWPRRRVLALLGSILGIAGSFAYVVYRERFGIPRTAG